jgi:hypothetical protein
MRCPEMTDTAFTGKEGTYERTGLSALFITTPFKIAFSSKEKGIEIVFRYPSGFKGFYGKLSAEALNKDIVDLLHMVRYQKGQLKEDGLQPLDFLWSRPKISSLTIEDKKITIYAEIPIIKFNPRNKNYVLILSNKLHDYLIGKITQEEIKEHIKNMKKFFKPILAEYSFNSIIQPSYCELGLVLITHRKTCPLASFCPFNKSGTERCRFFVPWERSHQNYAGLYKVVPEHEIKLWKNEDAVEKHVAQIPYKDLPFASVRFVEPVNIVAYHAGVSFLPKVWASFTRVKFKHTLGVAINLTSALEISFNEKTLRKILEEFGDDAKKWLEFKANMLLLAGFKGLGKRYSKPLNPWKYLEKFYCEEILATPEKKRKDFQSLLKLGTTFSSQELEEAKKFIVTHTFTHMILSNLWAKLGLSEEELGYVLTTDEHSGNITSWIFEARSGGYGYLRELAEKQDLFVQIVNEALTITSNFEFCKGNLRDTWINDALNIIHDIKSRTQKKDLLNTCGKLEQFLRALNEIYKQYRITPHLYTIRYCLHQIIPGEYREQFSKLINKLDSFFTPFDGNTGCYYFESGCTTGPFVQPFALSYRIAENLSKNFSLNRKIENRLEDVILQWISNATRSVDIATWNLAIYDYQKALKALEKASKGGAKIRILIGEAKDEATVRSIQTILQKFSNNAEIRLYTNGTLHKKTIIIDNTALLHGSFNFTKAALTKNIENAWLTLSPQEITKELEEFQQLWNSSKPITKLEDIPRY